MPKGLKPEGDCNRSLYPHSGEGLIYSIVIIEIDGIKTHANLDTSAGSFYPSAKLINVLLKQKAQGKEDLENQHDARLVYNPSRNLFSHPQCS